VDKNTTTIKSARRLAVMLSASSTSPLNICTTSIIPCVAAITTAGLAVCGDPKGVFFGVLLKMGISSKISRGLSAKKRMETRMVCRR
jgi:hypothetical protein